VATPALQPRLDRLTAFLRRFCQAVGEGQTVYQNRERLGRSSDHQIVGSGRAISDRTGGSSDNMLWLYASTGQAWFFPAWLVDKRWHVGTRRCTACGKEAGDENSSETNSMKVAYWQFRPPMAF
jgi:hypothetical protein